MANQIANEQALLAYERSGGQAWYLDAEGNPQPYIPGVSDLHGGTTLYRNPPAPPTAAPVPNTPQQSATVTAEQNYGTLPTGSETIATQAATVTPQQIAQTAAAQSAPPPATSSSPAPSSSQAPAIGGSGESVVAPFDLLSALGQSELTQSLSGLVSGFVPPAAVHKTMHGPGSTDQGAAAEGAWQSLTDAMATKIPAALDSINALGMRGF